MAKLVCVQRHPSVSLLPPSFSDFNGTRLLQFQLQYKRRVSQPRVALRVSASSAKKILIMGGTRFIGVFFSRLLVKEGYQTDAARESLRQKACLNQGGVNWTSIRPVYIYGALNYNPVEEWFFHRLKVGRPILVPNSGIQITQLGHDLATAFVKVLGNEKASKEVINISGEKYVTFDGLEKACAKHFFASIDKTKSVLGWKPEYDLVDGLANSYNIDFGRGTFRKEADFSTDDSFLARVLFSRASTLISFLP